MAQSIAERMQLVGVGPLAYRPPGTIDAAAIPTAGNSLAGNGYKLSLPDRWRLQSYGGYVVYENSNSALGFQSSLRGDGLNALAAVDFDVDLIDVVDLQGGLLARYALNRGDDAVNSLTIWQGPHHDLCTWDYPDMASAVDALRSFVIRDDPDGVVIGSRHASTRIQREVVSFATLDAEIDVESRSRRRGLVPSWAGTGARHGQVYDLGHHHDHSDGLTSRDILFVNETTVATITMTEPSVSAGVDHMVEAVVDSLSARWSEREGSGGPLAAVLWQ